MNATAEILQEYSRRQARCHLEDFTRYTKPDFTFGWFNQLLCQILEEFYDELIMGLSPNYMIFAPPRGGKSELVSRRFPAWVMGQAPDTPFIACSHTADLACDISGEVMEIMDSEEYHEIFPNVLLPTRKTKGVRTNARWDVIDQDGRLLGGRYIAAGVRCSITGRGFRIGLIDDPVKDYADASSPVKQEDAIQWYYTTFLSRRDPVLHGQLVVQTRWHRHDLSGKLIEAMRTGGTKFKIFNFPMECEEDVETFEIGGKRYRTRKRGDILFPERMDNDFVASCKVSSLTWAALYQQRPTLDGGNFFKSAWWDYYENVEALEPFERMIITGDTAQKTGEENDFSVFQAWGLKDHKIYLVDQIRGKWEAPDLLDYATRFWRKWGGGVKGPVVRASAMFVEDKASGTGLIQDLRRNGVPVVGIPRLKDKVTRAIDKQARFSCGFVVLPRNAGWLTEYLMEFEDFNLLMTHPHDDQVDPTLDAVDILLDGGGGLNYGSMTN